MKSVRNLIET